MSSYNLPKQTQELIDSAITTVGFDPNDSNAYFFLRSHAEKQWPTMGRRAIDNRVTKALRYLRTLDMKATRKARRII